MKIAKQSNWTDGSSLAQRVAKQFEQQFGRPADANDPTFVEFSRVTMPQLMEADRLALERSKSRWKTADRLAMAGAASPAAPRAHASVPA